MQGNVSKKMFCFGAVADLGELGWAGAPPPFLLHITPLYYNTCTALHTNSIICTVMLVVNIWGCTFVGSDGRILRTGELFFLINNDSQAC